MIFALPFLSFMQIRFDGSMKSGIVSAIPLFVNLRGFVLTCIMTCIFAIITVLFN